VTALKVTPYGNGMAMTISALFAFGNLKNHALFEGDILLQGK